MPPIELQAEREYMKKFGLLLTTCFLLSLCAACGQTAQPNEEELFVFTRENFPRINGSTSTLPLGEAVASVLLGETREEVAELLHFDKTTNAYRALINGEADILIVGEPAQSVLEEAELAQFTWEMTPFATDGFVFLVSEENSVDGLTLAEIQKIYTGEITNWAEVGGDDLAIIPLQRNTEAGSQTLMEKLVMDGLDMLEPPTSYLIGTMGGLMEAVRGMDGNPAAIGYSVYYYAEEMNMAGGLKLLTVDGVAPSAETIRNGEYPLLNPKYVVINAATPAEAPARVLFNWLLSAEGQRLVGQEGYVAIRGAEG